MAEAPPPADAPPPPPAGAPPPPPPAAQQQNTDAALAALTDMALWQIMEARGVGPASCNATRIRTLRAAVPQIPQEERPAILSFIRSVRDNIERGELGRSEGLKQVSDKMQGVIGVMSWRELWEKQLWEEPPEQPETTIDEPPPKRRSARKLGEELCGNQPVSEVILRNIARTFVNGDDVASMASRRWRRVDGVASMAWGARNLISTQV